MKIKSLIGAAVVAAFSLMITTPVSAVVSCPADSIRAGKNADTLAQCNVKEDNTLLPTVQVIIDVIIGVLGLVAVLVIILGGVSYTTSTGDPGKVKKAKDTIMYGIIGLIVAILAYAIVNFVLSSISKNQSSTKDESTGLVLQLES